MIMGLPLRSRYWSVLQVVATVSCYRARASSEIVQGCVGSRLSLRSEEMKVIQITAVVLGDSKCLWESCCIKDYDCTRNANANHTMDVHRRCDNKRSCTVDVLVEKIPCGYVTWSNNDFERITYICIDESQNVTMNSTTDEESMEDNHSPDYNSDEERTMKPDNSATVLTEDDTRNSTVAQPTVDTFSHTSVPDDSGDKERHTVVTTNAPVYVSSAILGIVIACLVCLIVILVIVASVSVVMVRRKKRHQVKSSETDRKEAIDAEGTSLNENAGPKFPICSNDSSKEAEQSLNSGAKKLATPASDYCELQRDREYMQLYEPVYEQPQ